MRRAFRIEATIKNVNVSNIAMTAVDKALAEKRPRTSAMQEPAPTNAASAAAANTSFSRIRHRSLIWFWANFHSLGLMGEKRRQEYHKAGPDTAVSELITFNG